MIQPNAQPGDLKYVDFNGDGKIDNLDRQDCGSAFPKVTLGINLGAEWKGFDLNLFFDGNFGNKIYNAQYFSTVYNEVTANQYAERAKSWTENNRNTDIPRYVSGNDNNGTNWGYTDRWLENGSFLRLKTLEFGLHIAERTGFLKAKMQSPESVYGDGEPVHHHQLQRIYSRPGCCRQRIEHHDTRLRRRPLSFGTHHYFRCCN